jgi:hypothetical protein
MGAGLLAASRKEMKPQMNADEHRWIRPRRPVGDDACRRAMKSALICVYL